MNTFENLGYGAVNEAGDVVPLDDIDEASLPIENQEWLDEQVRRRLRADRRRFNTEAEADAQAVEPEQAVVMGGAAVGLADRLDALEDISKLYGSRNKASGFERAMDIPHYRKEFSRRYADPSLVAIGMAAKSYQEAVELNQNFELLEARDSLKRAGFSDNQSRMAASRTGRHIVESFGENSNYTKRQKNLKGPRKTQRAL